MAWEEAQKQLVIDKYMAGDPTPENSVELCKEIAEELEVSANGVRMVLIAAGVYVKKGEASGTSTTKGTKSTGDKAPRVSKDAQIAALKEAIEASGKDADDEILSKLTGKAAAYFLGIIKE